MPVLASCDDEPPEPLIKDHFSSIVLVEAGIALRASLSRPSRTNFSKRNAQPRELRPLRSFTLLATLIDEGHGLQSFASLWGGSLRSLQYKQPYWEVSRTIRVLGDFKPASPVHTSPSAAALSEWRTMPGITNDGMINSLPGATSFSIPRIVVTPADGGDLVICLNHVPTQDAGHGSLLTVPDPDLEVINQSGHARALFDSPYLRRERLYSFPGACKKTSLRPVLAKEPAVVTCATQKWSLETLEEDENEALDLGPTWSG